jgi:5-(aminomethyl)-3-furanmethanol phosphate kinase
MLSHDWTVVKVSGSLFAWTELQSQLKAWLRQLGADRVLLVPGGGQTAEAIRDLDRLHHLGADAAHWLAIQAMSLNAVFLKALLPEADFASEPADHRTDGIADASGWCVLNALPFFRADESNADHLPHDWQVTSDSLAVRAAVCVNALELILLKSVAWDGADWGDAVRAGVVDGYFVNALKQTRPYLRVRVVNLRSWR